MLVLSRLIREEIVIGTGDKRVTVTVLEIRGNKVKLGFTGPKEFCIHRAEVAARVDAQAAQEASDASPG